MDEPLLVETRMTGRVLLLVGRGRYEDPWHDNAAVTHRVSQLAQERGLETRALGTFPDSINAVSAEDIDLLVVIAGRGRVDPGFDGDDTAWLGFHRRLAELIAGGLPVLALHQAANAFADSQTWAEQVGGRWVEGRSMHPPIGYATFRAAEPQHPVTAGLSLVEAYDERYCFLELDPRSQVLMTTHHEGQEHPVAWVAPGPGRVVYDGLGHDVRSYDSPSRRDFLEREIAWLLGSPGSAQRRSSSFPLPQQLRSNS